MLQALFAVPVLVRDLGISERERSVLRECALAAYRANNTNGKPWSRANRESLSVQEPVFEALFAMVARAAEVAFGVHVASITGRELVQFDGDFVPPHVEIDAAAEPKHACGDHNGSLVLQSPVGPFGTKVLPLEERVRFIDPKPDRLLVFPSHLVHFSHVYRAATPSVEVHFEMEIA
ncbi:MAG: hypothetical protein EB072_21055 [Betaproteobacteria bacterium]|nr:hypothetical protein [Betaproteobacteria bacterium]